ncbi:MAG: uL15 family ribosomal protein [bacterium]|nr:uL15 family ribosomal protein [bacterium]
MQIHQLKPKTQSKDKKRRGRGGKRGTYSGKGIKGQCSRAGHRKQPIIREFIKRYPKLKGYRSEIIPNNTVVINLQDIENNFETSEQVNPQILIDKRLVRRIRGKVPSVKILARGELKKKLVFENCEFSKTAKEAVEKSGSEIK